MSDDNHESTSENRPGEQGYEGKVSRGITALEKMLGDDNEYESVFIDPKGDGNLDGQSLDVSGSNPLDMGVTQ